MTRAVKIGQLQGGRVIMKSGAGASGASMQNEISRTVYIHIGGEKTGTTSVQEFFTSNRDYILDNWSLLYPTDDNICYYNSHLPLASLFLPGEKKTDFSDDLRANYYDISNTLSRLIGAHPNANFLISSEHLSSRFDISEIIQFKTFITSIFSNFVFKIIFCVRSQLDLFMSMLSTTAQHGFQGWSEYSSINSSDRYFNHYTTDLMWESVFGAGNIILMNYHELDAIDNICHSLHLADHRDLPRTLLNRSISVQTIEILELIHSCLGPTSALDFGHLAPLIENKLNEFGIVSRKLNDLKSEEMRRHFLNEFSRSNILLKYHFRLNFDLNIFL